MTRVILVLDAIDEAAPEVNQNLWETLDDLQIEFRTKKLDKFSILVTSRPVDAADYYIHSGPSINCSCCGTLGLTLYLHCDYCRGGDFDICQDCINAEKSCDDPRHELVDLEEEVRVDIEATEGEIRDYVTAELEHELKRRSAGHRDIRRKASTRGTTPLGRLLQEYPELGEKIKRVVPVRADRMFMLARLYMTTLRMKPGWVEVNDALEHLPHGYVGVYEDTMRRIVDPAIVEPSSADLARRALMWVVCAQKPLTLKQLQDALTKTTDLRLPYRHSEATLLEKTAGLIQIHGTVNPIHLTAFEYLRDFRDRWFPNASAEMALVCLQYLSQVELREPCQGLREDQEFNDRITKHPLAAYAYQHWGDHAFAAESRSSIHVAIMDFLSDEDRVAAMSQAMWYLEESGTTSWSLRKGASALHICAWFGLAEVMADLVESGIPADIRDISFQQSPLMLACRRGNRAAVIELTLSGADINATDSDGCDALYEAVKHSHSDVVSFLVSTGRLVNKAYTHVQQRTALMIAAESGDAEVVEHLLQSSSTHINQKDAQGFTALALACRSERLNIVNGLLSCPGIDINAQNSVGATCLHIAADSGNLLIVKTLLMRGIKHDVEDSEGRATAIARAVDNGSQAMLQIFVEHHVQISCRDERGRGLLHAAAINGHHSLLPYLVERGLDPNITDDQGRTPLHDAARLVDPTTAHVLCDIQADPTKRDNIGRLPSTIAWENGHDRVRDLLDERLLVRGIPPAVRNMAELPLWAMVKAGQTCLLEESLSRSENVSSEATRRDPDTGNSGLHYAASITELIGILKFLLDKKVFPLSEPNFISRTPLHMAVLGGNLDGCRALLEAGAAAEPADRWGSTAVQMACARNQWEIALLLIEEGADTAQCQIPLTTLLFTAVEYGKPKVVEILIDEGANVSVKNLYGQSPLQVAIAESNKRDESGQYEEIMHLLRQNKSNYERPILAKHVSAPTAFPQPDEAESDDKIMPLSTTFSKPKLADIADVQHIKKRVTF